MAKGNEPVAKFKIGWVTATVWQNDRFYNVVLSRSFKEGTQYKDTDQLGHGDLLNAVKVLQRAEQWIWEQG